MIKTKPFLECENWAELWGAHNKEVNSFFSFFNRHFVKGKRQCLQSRVMYVILHDRSLDRLVEESGEVDAKKFLEKTLTLHGMN